MPHLKNLTFNNKNGNWFQAYGGAYNTVTKEGQLTSFQSMPLWVNKKYKADKAYYLYE